MGWGINFDLGEAFSSAVDFVGQAADTVVHTAAVAVDGIEEGIGSVSGLVVGGLADVANHAVAGVGDVVAWAGYEDADNWRLYEGGWGTGINAVSSSVTEAMDDSQAFFIDGSVNWLLDQTGVDYQLQWARPPMRNDFDRVVFGSTKAVTEVAAGIAVVAATGGAGAALIGGSATMGSITTASLVGVGGYLTAAGTSYGIYSNVRDQMEMAEEEREMYEMLLTGTSPAQSTEEVDTQEDNEFHLVDPLAPNPGAYTPAPQRLEFAPAR